MSIADDPFATAAYTGTAGSSSGGSNPTRPPPSLTLSTPGGANGSAGGTKTPRRVQWTTDSHIVSMEPPPTSPSSTLDEAGLEELQRALERHKSARGGSRLRSRRGGGGGDDRDDQAESDNGEEDYDYRLDTGPYPQPESVDGSVNPSIDNSSPAGEDPDADLLGSYPPSRFVHPTAQGPPIQRPAAEEPNNHEDDIHNQMAVFVDPDETDGMPSMLPPEAEKAHNAAAASALVRAHTTGKFGGFLRNRKNNLKDALGTTRFTKSGRTTSEEESMEDFAKRYPEGGVNAARGRALGIGGKGGMGSAAGALAGGGVLASLLALYDNGQTASGVSTPAESRATSTAGSDGEESSDEERQRWEEEKRRKKEDKKRKGGWVGLGQNIARPRPTYSGRQSADIPRPPSTVPSTRSATPDVQSPVLSPTTRSFDENARSKSHGSLPSLGGRDGSQSPKFIQHVKKAADRMGLEELVDRPKAARSGGGVIGALMASTANITGAATPTGSSLVPAATRHGYRLSRFQLDGTSDQEPPSRPPSRPSSMLSTMHRVGSHVSAAEQQGSEGSPSSGKTQVDEVADNRTLEQQPTGRLNRPHKPFSLKSLGSMPHLPLTPASAVRSAGQWLGGGRSNPGSPAHSDFNEKGDYFDEKLSRASTFMSEDERKRKEWEAEKKKRKKAKEKKKRQEIFIIQHVAAILARQQFILKLARAFMMFGSPSHRLEAQLQATARVLEINCQAVYLPGTCLISFGDDATHTSETKFLKQSTGLDLGKLLATHYLYWDVVHDVISVDDASREIDRLMTTKPIYGLWPTLFIGGMCSAFICCIAFYGSFLDALISIPLGVLLIGIQHFAAKNDLYSNVFEITVAFINSFLAAALSSTNKFCFAAVVSSSIVLILPGYIVLCGALELASRNITSGSVRIAYSILYSLQLGFGLSIGVTLYTKITGSQVINASDYTCSNTHYPGAPWYMQRPSEYWYFLIAPGYSFWLSLRQGQPILAKETPVMILFACAGWTANHFSALAFPNRSDISSMVGSFTVGILGNIWGKFFQGNSFVVMLVGILFQLPSGLANGGILSFASSTESDTETTYANGFSTASSLVSVSMGLTVGLFVAAVVTNPFGGGRRRGNGIFSF